MNKTFKKCSEETQDFVPYNILKALKTLPFVYCHNTEYRYNFRQSKYPLLKIKRII